MSKHNIILIVLGLFASQICAWASMSAVAAQHLGFERVSTNQKVVALTFDADMTPSMLRRLKSGKVTSWYNKGVIDKLRELRVPATLFLTGLWIEAYPAVTKELSTDPLFELGNHSYSHGGFRAPCYGLTHVPYMEQVAEVRRTDELLSRYAVVHTRYFRFPGLCIEATDMRTIEAQSYIVVGGDVYSGDGFENNPAKVVHNVLTQVHPGSIVIFHMHGGQNAPQTANALPTVVQMLRVQGYAFLKVSELRKLNSWADCGSQMLLPDKCLGKTR